MQTIEELAIENGAEILEGKDFGNIIDGSHPIIRRICFDDSNQLESFAKAYMQATPVSVEPFGYFKSEPFGWTDCDKNDEGAVALYEAPQPADTVPREQYDRAIEALKTCKLNLNGYQTYHKGLVKRALAEAMKGE